MQDNIKLEILNKMATVDTDPTFQLMPPINQSTPFNIHELNNAIKDRHNSAPELDDIS